MQPHSNGRGVFAGRRGGDCDAMCPAGAGVLPAAEPAATARGGAAAPASTDAHAVHHQFASWDLAMKKRGEPGMMSPVRRVLRFSFRFYQITRRRRRRSSDPSSDEPRFAPNTKAEAAK